MREILCIGGPAHGQWRKVHTDRLSIPVAQTVWLPLEFAGDTFRIAHAYFRQAIYSQAAGHLFFSGWNDQYLGGNGTYDPFHMWRAKK